MPGTWSESQHRYGPGAARINRSSLNQIHDRALDAARLAGAFDGRYQTFPRGLIDLRTMLVISESYDYLTCHDYDGTTEGESDIIVAKPWFLRRAPFEGYERNGCTFAYTGVSSRTVTRTSDSSTEAQVIIPSYEPKSGSWPGDVIWAIECPTLAFTDPPNGPISWMEVFSTRQWCANCMNCQAP